MTARVRLEARDGIAIVMVDNPPVNALSRGVPDELREAIERASAARDLHAIVVIGAGRTFIAGADIAELERAAWDPSASLPRMHDVLRAIEDAAHPVVMALHGTALGGGLEIAMAGHYRIAARDARLGQPEVNLGIIPGAEGTQRLPRLVGLEKAIDMCVSGRPIAAEDARRAGLVDRVAEGDLLDAAMTFASDVAGRERHPKTREREIRARRRADHETIATGRALARTRRPNQPAGLAAVDAIAAAATLPFDEGCRRERELFEHCVRTTECRALVHAFLAERGVARVPGLPKDAPARPIAEVAIVGAGTMGSGIAMACANAGLRVVLGDANAERVGAGLETIRHAYQSSVARGRITGADVEARLGAIRTATALDACGTADLVVEAVFEDMALKQEVFRALDRIAKPDAVLATNTSTLDVDAIAAATSRPDAVVGLHFFSPAHVMRLVEIVRGRATSATVLATALALARRLGKVGVVVRNGEGFVGNRMMFPYMYEAQFLVEEGATPEQVDRVLTDFGWAMGIFAVDDLGGLDVAWRIRRELGQFARPGLRKPLVADVLVGMNRLGQKTGQGWYRYDAGDRTPIPDPAVLEIIERTACDAGLPRTAISDRDILERTMFALINEGAKVLGDGVALRAADIDVIYLAGYGFPAYRGGPMFYADTVGLPAILDRVRAFHRELGARWMPAPLLERLAGEGSTFRAWDARAAVARERNDGEPVAAKRSDGE